MAELISIGTNQTDSADFTLFAGEEATIYLKNGSGPQLDAKSYAAIQIKASNGEYFTIGYLNCREPAKVISGAGTYRVRRLLTDVAFGVDKN